MSQTFGKEFEAARSNKGDDMPRKRWVKLWTQETLYGTTSEELKLDEQAIWFKLLALAGDSPEPGRVEVAPGLPYSSIPCHGGPYLVFHRSRGIWLIPLP